MAKDEDLQLWDRWNTGGRKKEDLLPLLSKFEPLVEKQVHTFGTVNIPEPAIRAKAQMNVVDAVQSFDPNRGVKLNTHVNWHMNKLKRFVTSHQNFARIPEPMVYRISEYEHTENELATKLGRDPSIMEMAASLKWPPAHVERMKKMLRKDLSAPIFEIDPVQMRESRWTEVKTLIPYELAPVESRVYEALMKSRQPMTTAQLSTKLNMTPSQVNRAKRSISNKIGEYMG